MSNHPGEEAWDGFRIARERRKEIRIFNALCICLDGAGGLGNQ